MAKTGKKKTNPIDIHVGARMRLMRLERSISQCALGAAIGVSFQQVQKYEKGANRIGASTLWAIAQALKAPVGSFYDGLDARPPSKMETALNAAAQADVKFVRDYLALPPAVKSRARALVRALCEAYSE